MSDVTSLTPQDLPLDQVDRERWWTVVEMYVVLQLVVLNFGDECVTSYHIKITFPPPEHTYNYIAASINYTH